MKPVITAEQMRQADNAAMENGISSPVLMERAALSFVDEVVKSGFDLTKVISVCGTGNNGGDAAAAARILRERGIDCEIYLAGPEEKFSEGMRLQTMIARNLRIPFAEMFRPENYTLIIDGIFGIGLHRKVTGTYRQLIDEINNSGVPAASVDIPSGINTDTGAVMGAAVRADLTVTFAAGKPGLYLYPGASYAGKVCVRQIGIAVPPEGDGDILLMAPEISDLEQLPKRDPAGNKGTFGKLLAAAGSESMYGAAFLCAKAASASGAGMVRVYTHQLNRSPLAASMPEALMTLYREEDWEPEPLIEALSWCDCILAGPGLSVSGTAAKILKTILAENSRMKKPLILDADALNLIARREDIELPSGYPVIITPHIGEMGRLTGLSADEIKADPVSCAREFAAKHGVVCILKDARTVTAYPDGRAYLNLTGNSALSSAGSGDVLAGIVSCIAMQYGSGMAYLAPMIHGLTGEAAAEAYSEASASAGDLISFIHRYL